MSKRSGGTAELRERERASERERMAVPLPRFSLALRSKAGLNTSLSWLPHRAKDGTESGMGGRAGVVMERV